MACFVCLTRKYYAKNFQFHFDGSYGMLMYKRLHTANRKLRFGQRSENYR